MRSVPWWGVVSALAAPPVLIGGWTVAAGLQPHFDPVSNTVSALAAVGATDRWVMSLTFLITGLCYIVTALALRPARLPGRLVLIVGAAAGMVTAAYPEHPGGFGSVPHFVWASIGFAGLTLWPMAAWRRGPDVPWVLRKNVAITVVAFQFALLTWFGAELILGGHQVGVAERVVGAAQAAWPLTVVLTVMLAARAAVPPKTATVTALRWPHAGCSRTGSRPTSRTPRRTCRRCPPCSPRSSATARSSTWSARADLGPVRQRPAHRV